MILARITKAVREQNWFAVALEFLIVILGVVIGFQITAWNAERMASERETALLVRLREELETDQRERARSMNNIDRIRNLREAVDVLHRGEADELSFWQCNAIVTSNYYSDPSAAASVPALEELLNDARGLNLISDAGLRHTMADYVQYRDSIPRTVDWYVRGSVNLAVTFPDLIEQAAYLDADSGTIQTGLRCDLAAMRDDRAFRNALSENAWRYEYYYRSLIAEHNERVDALVEQISDVVGETGRDDTDGEEASQ